VSLISYASAFITYYLKLLAFIEAFLVFEKVFTIKINIQQNEET